jgi:hypothetical protein
MRRFYVAYASEISETPSRKSITEKSEILSRESVSHRLAGRFPLPWSHYMLLVRRSRSPAARAFYETEALRGGWTVRQLQRQIDTQFYERTALSRNKAAMLAKGAKARREDLVTAEEELKDRRLPLAAATRRDELRARLRRGQHPGCLRERQ